MNIDVSVIIPNYNGKEMLRECLDSLMVQNKVSMEIIVVDNASVDGSIELLENYPTIPILNSENMGFAVAVNQGIAAANGKYVFLLNNDVVLEEETLSTLLNVIADDSKCFSVQPKMMQYHNPDRIDDAGNIYTPFGWAFKRGLGLKGNFYCDSDIVFSCCAGAAMYDKEMVNRLGCFDESFFAYMEDVDIGFRARNHGYHNRYCAETKVYHIGSASFGKSVSPLKTKLSARNNLLTVLKNMSTYQIVANAPLLVIGFLFKWVHYSKNGTGLIYVRTLLNTLVDVIAEEPIAKQRIPWAQVCSNQLDFYRGTCTFIKELVIRKLSHKEISK